MRMYYFLLVLLLNLYGCSLGNLSDEGLEVFCNEVEIEDIFLSSEGELLEKQRVTMGSRLTLHVIDPQGFIAKEGKYDLGASYEIRNAEGEILFENEDILAITNPDGIPVDRAEELTLFISIIKPLQVEKDYTWKVNLYDKRSEANMQANVHFEVLPF